MNLADLLNWTAELAGCDHVPEDFQVYVEASAPLKRVLVGVDVDGSELLYARQAGFDAVIAHHPMGDHARTDFARVVARQVDQMTAEGIDRERAVAAVEQRLGPVHRQTHMSNINRTVDTARLIGMPVCNVHLACDLIGRQAIVDLLAARAGAGATVADALGWLEEIPEIAAGMTRPEAWLGEPDQLLGRYTVAMAGGTNGGHPVFREYYRAGVDTVLAMHIAEGDLGTLRADPLAAGRALVVTGHMATDSIGINVMIRGLEQRGVTVVRTSGVLAPAD